MAMVADGGMVMASVFELARKKEYASADWGRAVRLYGKGEASAREVARYRKAMNAAENDWRAALYSQAVLKFNGGTMR